MKESMVVLQTNVDGEKVICMPITKLQAIEDTASVKTAADNDDYFPIIDSSDDSQMKKIKAGNLLPGNATQSANGLMSSADKKKLDGVATGAEVNQNAFSNVVIGSTTISADSKTDSLTLAGSNVTITPDATNDKVTIGITKANVTSALGYTPPTTDTTYGVATTSANGLMSKDDKSKLDGITTGADSVSFSKNLTSGTKVGTITINGTSTDLYAPTNTDTKVTAVGNHYTPSGGTTTSASGGSLTDITNSGSGVQVLTGVTKDAAGHVTGVTSVALKSVNTTYSAATASAAGIVSTSAQTFAGDKTFNGKIIPAGAGDVGTAQARKIYAGTEDLTAGTSELETGAIYLVYE